mmetsp:Transcript_6686/g.12296  ORF Transcript_6686/g.12296 Transcript_6686/m.12296 type:complete len:408 (-) Transcript_6686:136-1359(-)
MDAITRTKTGAAAPMRAFLLAAMAAGASGGFTSSDTHQHRRHTHRHKGKHHNHHHHQHHHGSQKRGENPPPMGFLIGAAKCGTSSLWDSLYMHPGICKSKLLKGEPHYGRKEIHFWDKRDNSTHAHETFDTYKSHFEECPAELLRMDGTPSYISEGKVPGYLKEVYEKRGIDTSKLRFVLELRDPAERSYSLFKFTLKTEWHKYVERPYEDLYTEEIRWWNNCVKRSQKEGYNSDSLWQYCQLQTGCVMPGLYEQQLRNWFLHFHPSQFLVVTLKQYQNDKETMKAIQRHLRLNEAENLEVKNTNQGRYNKKQRPPMPEELLKFYNFYNIKLMDLADKYPKSFYKHKISERKDGKTELEASDFFTAFLSEEAKLVYKASYNVQHKNHNKDDKHEILSILAEADESEL